MYAYTNVMWPFCSALSSQLTTDASLIQSSGLDQLASIVETLFLLLSCVAVGIYFSWRLTVVIIASVPVVGVSQILLAKLFMESQKKVSQSLESSYCRAGCSS